MAIDASGTPMQQQQNQSRGQIGKAKDVAKADWLLSSCRQDTGITAAQQHITQESERRKSGWNHSLDSNETTY